MKEKNDNFDDELLDGLTDFLTCLEEETENRSPKEQLLVEFQRLQSRIAEEQPAHVLEADAETERTASSDPAYQPPLTPLARQQSLTIFRVLAELLAEFRHAAQFSRTFASAVRGFIEESRRSPHLSHVTLYEVLLLLLEDKAFLPRSPDPPHVAVEPRSAYWPEGPKGMSNNSGWWCVGDGFAPILPPSSDRRSREHAAGVSDIPCPGSPMRRVWHTRRQGALADFWELLRNLDERPLHVPARKVMEFYGLALKVPVPVTVAVQNSHPASVKAELMYRPADPFAVHLIVIAPLMQHEFHQQPNKRQEPVEWTFSRELLKAGLTAEAGEGDVQVWPHPSGHVRLRLQSPTGKAVVQASQESIKAFLEESYQAIPPGSERRYMETIHAYSGLGDCPSDRKAAS